MVKNFGKGSQGGIAPKDNTHVSTDGSARFNWQYMNQVIIKVNFINWFKGTDGLTQIEKALMTMIQEEKTRILQEKSSLVAPQIDSGVRLESEMENIDDSNPEGKNQASAEETK